MNDYKELIGDIGICLIAQPNQTLYKQLLREATNAIVQLVKERDAAVEDIACLANDPNVPAESLCKKFTNHGCCCYNYFTGEQVRDCIGFEWRGVREDNDERA